MRAVATGIVLGGAIFAAAPASLAANEPGSVVPLREYIGDRTPAMWSARWWMWAASPQHGSLAVRDLEGTQCGAGQEGEVFFLAGTFADRPVQRTCRVPAGKFLFFPIVAYIVMPNGAPNCSSHASTAAAMTDEPSALFAELDGVAIPKLEARRVATGDCFNVNAMSRGPPLESASNGYWLMLRPLKPGKHVLHFGGTLPSLRQDITYTLVVS
jgi:hypothetical protein